MVNKPKPTLSKNMLDALKTAGGVETRSHDEWVKWKKNNPENGNWSTGKKRWGK